MVRLTHFTILSSDELPRELSSKGLEQVSPLKLSPEPIAEPPVPQDAPVQQILFEPPVPSAISNKQAMKEQRIVMSFVMSEPHVAVRMQQAVRNVYALYGKMGLSRLSNAIAGLSADNRRRPWPEGLEGEPFLESDPFDPRIERTPRRRALANQFMKEEARLNDMITSTQSSVEQVAVEAALKRLRKSQGQVLAETKRYLSLPDNDDETAASALNSDSLDQSLAGPDTLPLATALLRIDDARATIEQAERNYEKISRPERTKRAAFVNQRLGWLSPEELRDQNLVEIWEEADRAFPDTPEMRQARQAIADQEAQFAAVVAAEAVAFPILYRLWSTSYRSTSFSLDEHALSGSFEFRESLLTTLRRTWYAAGRSEERIRNGDLEVWRYPPLVSEALRRLAVPPGTIEWQAVNERLDEEEGAVSPWSAISTTAGILEFGIVLAGAPPVAAAIEGINVALSIAEWVEEAFEAREQQDAFDCSLDPTLSFAAEPSYVGLLVGLAFTVLDVRGVLKTTRVLEGLR